MPDQLAKWSEGTWKKGSPSAITGFSIDTRTIAPGELFVALETPRRDGHDYLEAAASAGASAALVHKEQASRLPQLVVNDSMAALQYIARGYRDAFHGPVIGVTGSAGKTSTKDMLALLLGEDVTHKTRANLNNHLGVPLTLLQIDPARHRYAVVEAGISELAEMKVLAEICRPDIGIVTLVAPAHLEGLGTVENVATEKCQLLQHIRPGGLAVFPSDCLQFKSFQDLPVKSIVITPKGEALHGISPFADPVYYSTEQHGMQTKLTLAPRHGTIREFEFPGVSEGMSRNAIMAILVASHLGVSDDLIALRLSRWHPVAFRGQIVEIGDKKYFVDCYNANPASMSDSLSAFAHTFPALPKLYVLGCMNELGPTSAALHQNVGSTIFLGEKDQAFILGKDATAFAAGLIQAGNSNKQVHVVTSINEVAASIHSFSGAVLLKGSRSYQLEMLLPEIHQAGLHIKEVAC